MLPSFHPLLGFEENIELILPFFNGNRYFHGNKMSFP